MSILTKKKLNEHKIYTLQDKKRGTFTEEDIKVPKRKSRIFRDPITGRNYTLTTHGRYTYVD